MTAAVGILTNCVPKFPLDLSGSETIATTPEVKGCFDHAGLCCSCHSKPHVGKVGKAENVKKWRWLMLSIYMLNGSKAIERSKSSGPFGQSTAWGC